MMEPKEIRRRIAESMASIAAGEIDVELMSLYELSEEIAPVTQADYAPLPDEAIVGLNDSLAAMEKAAGCEHPQRKILRAEYLRHGLGKMKQ